jgi:carbonic anhydrase
VSVIDELLQRNSEYAASFDKGELPAAPARRVAIVTCMDARFLPSRVFGLGEGEAHIIRNAGGSAREALRSLVVSQRLLATKEAAIVKHTDCGMLRLENEDLQAKIKDDLGADATGMDFLPFASLQDAVREDVAFLKSSPLVGDDVAVRGFVYDVTTGRVSEVDGPPDPGAG